MAQTTRYGFAAMGMLPNVSQNLISRIRALYPRQLFDM